MAAARADQEVTAAGEECGESAGVEEASKHAPLSPGERARLEGWRLLLSLHEIRGETSTLSEL